MYCLCRRYCLVNDTDSAISAEEAFSVYLQQMRETGELPFLCASRKVLVHRVLFDMKALSGLTDLWRMNRHKILKNGVQLVFFATPSGLIKFWDELPPGMLRMNPNPLEPTIAPVKNATAALLQQRYIHFIKEQNQRSVEDRYFRRSIRVRNRIVVDINKKSMSILI
ncbi:hypothetical protein AB6A40_009706 [Gnathostoma spinigerum]|uniref:Uncharacterized protein n=1 Tax=Gnathostoma spinigerum TaxID=75299 RepID=A0ABD6F148_9BILA